jgi:hypothetical protein
MSAVNPPSALKIPQKLLQDRELRDYFEQRDFIQYQLWLRTGGQEDIVGGGDEQGAVAVQAQINVINERLGSGDPLTWDDTGFTWDNTHLTWDRTTY